ncbi:MAG: hypothetical protein WC461_01080 [Candidatus Paceibacterota bacterium]
MANKIEGVVSILAALLVLFTAMLEPIVSTIIALVFLVGLGVYELIKK